MTDTQRWRVTGESLTGTYHQQNNLPCQDAFNYHVSSRGELMIAIADGAGSAERSHEGAQIAVDQAMISLQHTLSTNLTSHGGAWQRLMRTVIQDAQHAVENHATAADSTSCVFATTLMCIVVTHDLIIAGQIGDGVVVAESQDGTLFTVMKPQRGEYANETHFLTDPDVQNLVDIHVQAASIVALVAMTDGLLRLAMQLPDCIPAQQFFQPILAFAADITNVSQAHGDLRNFLASERICHRTDDDKTLVLATRCTKLLVVP